MTDVREGPILFEKLPSGREAAKLGCIVVAEIMPLHHQRHGACFRVMLPDAAITAWRPTRDIEAARRGVASHVNDWMNAADLRPNIIPED